MNDLIDILSKPTAYYKDKVRLIDNTGEFNNQLHNKIRIQLSDDSRVSFLLEENVIQPNPTVETTNKDISDIFNNSPTSNKDILFFRDFFRSLIQKTTPMSVETVYISLWERGYNLDFTLGYLNIIKNWISELRMYNMTLLMNISPEFDTKENIINDNRLYNHLLTEHLDFVSLIKDKVEYNYIVIELLITNFDDFNTLDECIMKIKEYVERNDNYSIVRICDIISLNT